MIASLQISKPVVVAVFIALICVFPTRVQAQAQSDIVFQQQNVQADLVELRASYQGQLQEYRTLYQQHQVAVGQYQQLQTLSTLDAAVIAAQKVMAKRAQVLDTYLRILTLELQNTQGIDLSLKEIGENLMAEASDVITVHRADLQNPVSREAITAWSADFEPIYELVRYNSTIVQATIQLGRLQTSHDKLASVKTRFLDTLQTSDSATASASLSPQLQRSLTEVETAQDRVESMLLAFEQNLVESLGRGRFNDSDTLLEIHGALGSSIALFKEFVSLAGR